MNVAVAPFRQRQHRLHSPYSRNSAVARRASIKDHAKHNILVQ